MKLYIITVVFLVLANSYISQAKSLPVMLQKTETIKQTENQQLDSAKRTRTIRLTFNSKIGASIGVYNFWEASRNLSAAVNMPIPHSSRFGAGLNYFANCITNNKHWFGINADIIANFPKSQYGFTTNSAAFSAMVHYGINVKSRGSKSPLFPFVAFGPGASNLFVSSNNDIAASNLTNQFSSLSITNSYLTYKIGIASMAINKKGFPGSTLQLGYLGSIPSNNWNSGGSGNVTDLKSFGLSGVFFSMTY